MRRDVKVLRSVSEVLFWSKLNRVACINLSSVSWASHCILPLADHLFLMEFSEIIDRSIEHIFCWYWSHVYCDRYCYCFIDQPYVTPNNAFWNIKRYVKKGNDRLLSGLSLSRCKCAWRMPSGFPFFGNFLLIWNIILDVYSIIQCT